MEAKGGGLLSMKDMFADCDGITSLDINRLNTDYVSDMSGTFSNCSSLSQISGLDVMDTSRVTDMSGMFNGCLGLSTLDLNSFDTDIVTDMSSMFAGCNNLVRIFGLNGFNTSSVVDMSYMFWGCFKLEEIDLSTFVADVLLDTTQMFSQCCSIEYLDLSSFDTHNVLDMKAMFWRSNSLECITNLDTTSANNPAGRTDMFVGCDVLVEPDTLNQADLQDGNGARWVNTNPCPVNARVIVGVQDDSGNVIVNDAGIPVSIYI
jgi:surface protein